MMGVAGMRSVLAFQASGEIARGDHLTLGE